MSASILQPGRNCWRIDRARHVHVIQDAADYFRLVRRALLGARSTVFSLSWDLTGVIDLEPDAPPSGVPTRLDKLVAHITHRERWLRVFLLTWDYGLLFSLERDPFTRLRMSWSMPRRVRFAFDNCHPMGACHHQKIVVIDDELAFSGGIDLTSHRWDTPAHRPDEPHRVTPLGSAYGPYHEVQAMVDGPVAASLGALARDRWRAAGVDNLPAILPTREDLWPADVTPDFTDVDVAISRTLPGSETAAPVRECEALFLDAIAAARRCIYIENQYFTNFAMTDALIARLAETVGPEVVIAVPRDSHGWMEKKTIGAIRDHLFRRLVAADLHRRLRLVAPIASRARDAATFVHSKVMIVDDELLRVGSANCSHRSMGVDTECDLAIEARGDPRIQSAIRRTRDRLIGEHLGLRPEMFASALERAGSLCGVLDQYQTADRTLARVELPAQPLPLPSDAVRLAVDPDEPMTLGGTPVPQPGGVRRRVVAHTASAATAAAYALRTVPVIRRAVAALAGRRERAPFD